MTSVLELRKTFENVGKSGQQSPGPNGLRPGSSAHGYDYEQVEAIAKYITAQTQHRPRIGIICGSGLGGIADQLDQQNVIPYQDIPNFPVSTVAGHSGCLVFGNLNRTPVVCMKGRLHPFEGYPTWKCSMPVRVMKLIGVDTLIVTNAAGGLNKQFAAGDIMIIKDHINFPGFAGEHPLRGKNDDRWGPRFPPMNNAYDRKLVQLANQCARELDVDDFVRQGVYVMVHGPTFETIAEARALRQLGGDAVGMSTVHEVTVAHHCGIKVLGFSLISNVVVDDYDDDSVPNHEEVMEMGKKRAQVLEKLVGRVLQKLSENGEIKSHVEPSHHRQTDECLSNKADEEIRHLDEHLLRHEHETNRDCSNDVQDKHNEDGHRPDNVEVEVEYCQVSAEHMKPEMIEIVEEHAKEHAEELVKEHLKQHEQQGHVPEIHSHEDIHVNPKEHVVHDAKEHHENRENDKQNEIVKENVQFG